MVMLEMDKMQDKWETLAESVEGQSEKKEQPGCAEDGVGVGVSNKR